MSTQLVIRYSYIYEETLAKLTTDKFEWADFERSQKFVTDFTEYWKSCNDKVFSYYKELGLTLPEFWIAYAINKRKGMYPISDPLTFFIDEDFDKAASILIHELCHVFLIVSENMEISNILWKQVSEKYPDENFNTMSHLLVNLLAKGGVTNILGEEKANKLLLEEREIVGLKEAWAIIDTKKEVLEEINPLEAIRKLSSA